jgi:hypothetical protein
LMRVGRVRGFVRLDMGIVGGLGGPCNDEISEVRKSYEADNPLETQKAPSENFVVTAYNKTV